MKRIVIGLIGPKTCGKSTVANILSEFYNIKEIALADKLKNASAKAFDLDRLHFDKQDLKETSFDKPKFLTQNRIRSILNDFNVNIDSFKDPFLMQTYKEFYQPITGRELRSPREVAQIVGTEVLRCVDQDIHCKNISISDKFFTVVSDVRFSNEYNYFNSMGNVTFIPIYIQRDFAEANVTLDSHISEREFMDFRDKCFKVNNNGSLKDTELQVKQIVDKVLYGGK
jgi:ABC-type oligopeptide transport system ATPase subunit